MGNNNQQIHRPAYDSTFPMHRYLNRGLSQSEILKVKETFDYFEPVNGYIDSNKVSSTASNDKDKITIDRIIGNKPQINFDQFFQVSSRIILQKKRDHPNVEIDSSQVQATCLFCPYTEDVRK